MQADDHGYIYDLLIKLGLTDFGARTGEFLLVRPLKILLILVVAMVLSRLGARTIRRFLHAARLRAPLRGEARAEQRLMTIGDVLGGLWRALVGTVAVFMILDQLGMNLAPLIAGAGIAGIAVGFGAQSMVKDFLAGLFILIEDQYGVGDVVNVGDATGTIEDISLRVTRLRAVDGTVWFVPNGEIKKVGNTSMEWSRALVDVIVPYDADVAKATTLIGEEANALAADPAWSEHVLEAPEVWGVQEMGTDGLTIRLVMKTAPRQQFAIARELRGRISARLRREGIKGPGQTVLVTSGALDQGAPPIPPPEED